MVIHVDLGWLASMLLVMARVAGAIVLVPVLGPTNVPPSARVVLVVGLAVALVSGLPAGVAPRTASVLDSIPLLAGALLSETLIGAAFAFGFLAAYAATSVAGRALDTQMGIGAASVFNPTLRTPSPIMGAILGLVGVAAFLALDGHLALVRALATSVRAAPPGAVVSAEHFALAALLAQSGIMWSYGLLLAAPVMFLLLLTDVAIGLASRSVPQLNAFVIGFAVKILLGFLALAASLRLGSALFERLFGTTFRYWEQLAVPAG